MSEQISAGDRVRLKSGGPTMTVDRGDRTTAKLKCQWFTDNELQMGMFTRETLKLAPPGDRE